MFSAHGFGLPAEQRRASTPNITGWSQIIPQQDVSPSSSESDAHELLEFEMLMAQQIQDSSIAQSQLWPSLGSGYPGMTGTIPLSSFPSTIPDRCLEELPLSAQHDPVLQTLHAAFPEAGSSAPNFGAVDVSVQAHDVTRQPLRDQPSGGPLHTHNLSPPADQKHSRSRTHHACQPCRQRKAKCNGTVPCNRCQSRDTECVYSAERKVRGPNKVKHRPSPLVLVDSLIKKQRRGRAPVRSRSRSNEPLEPQSSASSTFSLPNEPPLSAGSSVFTSSTDPPSSTGSSSSQEASALFGPESYETLLSFLPLEDGKLDEMSIHTPQSLPPRLLPPGTYSHMSFRGSDELGPPQFDLMGDQASPESDFLDLLSSSSEPSSAEPSYPSSPMLEPTSSFAIDPILEALSVVPAIEHSTPRKAGRHRGMSDSMLLSSSFSAATLKADELIDTTNAHTATGQSLDLV